MTSQSKLEEQRINSLNESLLSHIGGNSFRGSEDGGLSEPQSKMMIQQNLELDQREKFVTKDQQTSANFPPETSLSNELDTFEAKNPPASIYNLPSEEPETEEKKGQPKKKAVRYNSISKQPYAFGQPVSKPKKPKKDQNKLMSLQKGKRDTITQIRHEKQQIYGNLAHSLISNSQSNQSEAKLSMRENILEVPMISIPSVKRLPINRPTEKLYAPATSPPLGDESFTEQGQMTQSSSLSTNHLASQGPL